MQIRPYLTTGLAFVGAAVIVATPITSPHADVQVSAVAVSAGGQSPQDVLDPAFLETVGADDSPNFGEALRQFVDKLVDGAGEKGDDAVADLFADSPDGSADPRQLQERLRELLPDAGAAGTPQPGQPAAPPAFDPAAVQDLIRILVEDATHISDETVAAVQAAGVVAAGQPQLILNTLTAAANGDVEAAAHGLALIATSPFGPSLIVVNAITTVVEQRLAELPGTVIPDPSTAEQWVLPDAGSDELPAAQTAPGIPSAAPADQPGDLPNNGTDAPNDDDLASTPVVGVATEPDMRDGNKTVPLLPDDAAGPGGQMPTVRADFEDHLKTVVADIKDKMKKASDERRGAGGGTAGNEPV